MFQRMQMLTGQVLVIDDLIGHMHCALAAFTTAAVAYTSTLVRVNRRSHQQCSGHLDSREHGTSNEQHYLHCALDPFPSLPPCCDRQVLLPDMVSKAGCCAAPSTFILDQNLEQEEPSGSLAQTQARCSKSAASRW